MVLKGSESGGVLAESALLFASEAPSDIMSGLEVEHGSEDTGHDLVNGETSPTPPSSSGSPSHKLDNINLMLADSFGDKTKLDDAAAAIIPNGNAEVASSRQQDQQQQAAKQSAASTDDVSLAPADRLWTTERDGAVLLRINASGPLSDTPETINQLFERTVKLYGDHKALASKEGNTWKILTYKEYYAQCRQAAKSFLKLGLQRYHGVGILGFNSAEWFISDIGAILAGGFAVGIYTTNSAEACQYVADNCLANIIVVENDKQLQKILEVQSQLPHLKAIVQYKGELKEKKPNVYSWAEFMRAGEEVPDAQLDAIIASQRANQCCSLIYTSGTTGSPKGVMLSHDNLTWTATVTGELTQLRSADDNYQEVVISYLPLSHIAAQLVDIWLPMRFGGVTYFAQPDALKGSLVVTMKEVRPTGFMGVPRVWEKMMEKMKATAAKSGIFKRKIAGWAKSVGLQTHLANMKGNPAEAPMGYTLANMLVFKKVREALGLDRCTKCYTGAAPITRDTLEFFLSLDIPVFELYGMSESSGPHTISSPTAFQIGSCGTLLRGCRTLLHSKDEEGSGEVCFWGRHVFMGYLNMEEKTREAIDDDGWLHSGDLGRVDEQGLLYITGRIKELIITAGGENVPPIPIEDAIKEELPVVSNAMVIGDRRKFLSVLLTLKCESNGDSGEPDDALTDEVVHWCQRVGSTATRASQIAGGKDPVVERAIRDGIERVNKRAPSNAQRVQKWELLLRDFSIPGGELGPTMKLKRPVVTKIYQELIERLYEDAVSPTTPDAPLPTQ